MPNESFNYGNINAADESRFPHKISEGDFISVLEAGHPFILFGLNRNAIQEQDTVILNRRYGWKFHISIDDEDPENITSGWNLVKDLLIDNRVYRSKVVSKGHHMSYEVIGDGEFGEQRGKQITIYTSYQPDKPLEYWNLLVLDITQILAENSIKPSYRPESDIPVEGSHYVSYRCDGVDDIRGQNMPTSRYAWHDDVSKEELARFSTIRVVAPAFEQPPIPNWEPPSVGCCHTL